MVTAIGSLSDAATAVVLIAMFVIVFVVARGALKEVPLFGGAGSWPVAFCTAALSVLGLLRFLGPQEHGARADSVPVTPGGTIDFILLPFAILLVLHLLAWGRVRPGKSVKPRKQQPTRRARGTEALIKQHETTPPTLLRTRLEKQPLAAPRQNGAGIARLTKRHQS